MDGPYPPNSPEVDKAVEWLLDPNRERVPHIVPALQERFGLSFVDAARALATADYTASQRRRAIDAARPLQ